jgi:hypothetical protein
VAPVITIPLRFGDTSRTSLNENPEPLVVLTVGSFIEKDFNKKDITFTKIALAIAVTSVMVAVAIAPVVLSQALILMLLFLSGTHSKDIHLTAMQPILQLFMTWLCIMLAC